MVHASDEWKKAYPDAVVGMLVIRGVRNPDRHEGLERLKADLEKELRGRCGASGQASAGNEAVEAAYDAYYKRFRKSYHVSLQLDSIVTKGRHIPSVSPLVEAMFMAELKNMLLTAGHDLGALEAPIEIGVADGSERYVTLRGEERALKAGDMMMADTRGVISSILYGPDSRSKITSGTRDVLFVVYAPPGIGGLKVDSHLRDIKGLVEVFAPEARMESVQLIGESLR